MPVKNPAERAITDVEKAIKAADTALEKAQIARQKADELVAVANRAEKTLRWSASHPDLPDDFDLNEFRRALAAPFEDDDEDEDDVDPVGPDEGEIEAVREGEADVEAGRVATLDAADEDDEDDNPFDDED